MVGIIERREVKRRGGSGMCVCVCVSTGGGGAADVLILMEGGWWRDGRASNCQVIMHKVPTLPYLKLSVPTREFLDHFHWCNGAIN